MGRLWISPSRAEIKYTGRIEFADPQAPVFACACSHFRFRIQGREAALVIGNRHGYYENSLGVLVDGAYRGKIVLHDGERECGETAGKFLLRMEREEAGAVREKLNSCGEDARIYDLTPFLDGAGHEITVFKRTDTCHYFTFYGMLLDREAELGAGSESPERRMEVYGDSVSCGEVSEALGRCGMDDPEGHNGIYSNSYYSYSWILARKLGAELHNVSQGGISLLDGDGYFNGPDCLGMLSCYDKTLFCPGLGEVTKWDFEKYTPQLVIVAIGQNDAHPENYMGEDYDGEKAGHWRTEYRRFISLLRSRYPRAWIILTTTILGHDPAWDRAIGQVAQELGDDRIRQFLYTQNGSGTSGHIRRPEAERMAQEMAAFLDGLGEDIWENKYIEK